MNTYISLDSIQIATPCHANWNQMTGDDKARHCQSCNKNVYNFSALTRAEAERLLLEKEGHLCVRLHRRADGTVITSDCPVGISPAQKSAGALRTVLAAALATILGVFGIQTSHASRSISVTAGAPVAFPMTGMVAPTMGKPVAPPLMGEIAATIPKPTAKPSPKSVKMPVKHHANRASRPNSRSQSALQHRRHR